MVSTRKLKIYRSRVKSSRCRRIRLGRPCRRFRSCKNASGKTRKFCRKLYNKQA